MKATEYHTRKLNAAELQSAMDALPALIEQALGNELFTAMYGFDCNIHGDLTYVPMRIMPRHLSGFFSDSIAQHIFRPGGNDLLFEFANKRLTITFCHEGDLHFGGEDMELVERFLSSTPFCEYGFSGDTSTHDE